jgi:hypothetical protein
MGVETVSGLCLIGFMSRERAVKHLVAETVTNPCLTEEQAESIWARYRSAVEALPERPRGLIPELPLSPTEAEVAKRFRRRHRGDTNALRIIKVDPMDLVVHQLVLVSEVSDNYQVLARGRKWAEACLFQQRKSRVVSRSEPDGMYLDLPHGEFVIAMKSDLTLAIQECARYVGVVEFHNRLLLAGGHHRCYVHARRSQSSAANRSRGMLVVLTSTRPPQLQGGRADVRELVSGARPPLLRDFLDERLALPIQLRKKRFEVRVQYRMVDVTSTEFSV